MKAKILSFSEAKAFLKPLELRSKDEYDAWWNANKPEFLPQFPEEYYRTIEQEGIEYPCQKTLDDVLAEIREIIKNTHWVQTRLAKLESRGFKIEECWVKNGSIETMWFMKRKEELRIQVTDSEPQGDFQKADCVIIPASEIQFQKGDSTRVRNLPDFK